MRQLMYLDRDRWRAARHRIGQRLEAPPAFVRFSRRLLVASALFLIIVGVFDLL
jgi:hypothetical protein